MKRPLAYITAAWCGIPEVDTDLAVEFCRAAYGLQAAAGSLIGVLDGGKSALCRFLVS